MSSTQADNSPISLTRRMRSTQLSPAFPQPPNVVRAAESEKCMKTMRAYNFVFLEYEWVSRFLSGRGVRAFNPLSRDDTLLFQAMMAGEHCIRGLMNADIRARLEDSPHLRDLAHYPKRQSAKVSRILSRFHAHKLIAKIPHTRKWRVTDRGRRVMAASLCLRDAAFPELYHKAAAA